MANDENSRRNLLFVFSDQQSALAMSGSGTPWVATPNLNRLAARGVRFDRTYCAAPVCGPSRACLVTGRAAHENGVRWNGQPLNAGTPTFGQVIRKLGYDTAWAGKWHLPLSYPPQEVEIPGFENLAVPPEHPLLKREIGYGWPGFALGANTDGLFVDEAIRFLDRPRRNPFCLVVSLHNPHDICWWIRKPKRLPGPAELPPLPANFGADPDEPEFLQQCRQRGHYGEELRYTEKWTDEDWRLYLHAYYRMTEHVDAEVGRLLTALEKRGLNDNTVVIFTSDHGEGMAAHRWVVKLAFHEEVVRVPLIVAGPGVRGAGRVDSTSLVSGLDIFPTLCEAAGAGTSTGGGRSLWPLLKGECGGKDRALVVPLDPDDKAHELTGRMVVTARFKYCRYSVGERCETLHDLVADPGEQRNLAQDPRHRSSLEAHRARLREWMYTSGDRVPQFADMMR